MSNDNDFEKKLLYDFITSEINNIDKENRKPGWTIWAILVSLSTLVWLLFNSLENNVFYVKNIIINIVIFCFLFDFLSLVLVLLGKKGEAKNKFFYANEGLTSSRISLIFIIAKYSILIILINNSVFNINLIFIKFTFFINLIFVFITFVLSFIKFPLFSQEKRSIYLIILYSIFYLFIFYKIVIQFPNIINLFCLNDMKISLIICAIYYLLYLLSRNFNNKNINSQSLLMNLRKDLVLKKDNLNDIRDRLEIIIDGLKISAIFQEYTNKYISISEDAIQISENIIQNLSRLEETLQEKSDDFTDKDKIIAENILAAVDALVDRLTRLIKKSVKIYNRFNLSIKFLSSTIDQDYINEIQTLFNKINDVREKKTDKIVNIKIKIKNIKTKILSTKE